jgi:hypothetical protein
MNMDVELENQLRVENAVKKGLGSMFQNKFKKRDIREE